jgi:hypothetical protein
VRDQARRTQSAQRLRRGRKGKSFKCLLCVLCVSFASSAFFFSDQQRSYRRSAIVNAAVPAGQACLRIESASVFTSWSMCDFSTMYGGAITTMSPAGRTSAPFLKQSMKMS